MLISLPPTGHMTRFESREVPRFEAESNQGNFNEQTEVTKIENRNWRSIVNPRNVSTPARSFGTSAKRTVVKGKHH